MIAFLDSLSYGSQSTLEARERYTEWEGKVMQSGEWLREMLRASRDGRSVSREGD